MVNGVRSNIDLNDVLLVPKARYRFLSISKLTSLEFCVQFQGNTCTISRRGINYGVGNLVNGTYWLCLKPMSSLHLMHAPSLSLWHERFGHTSYATLQHANDGNIANFVLSDKTIPDSPCPHCATSRQPRAPFPPSEKRAPSLFHTIHSDLMGPLLVASIQ